LSLLGGDLPAKIRKTIRAPTAPLWPGCTGAAITLTNWRLPTMPAIHNG